MPRVNRTMAFFNALRMGVVTSGFTLKAGTDEQKVLEALHKNGSSMTSKDLSDFTKSIFGPRPRDYVGTIIGLRRRRILVDKGVTKCPRSGQICTLYWFNDKWPDQLEMAEGEYEYALS